MKDYAEIVRLWYHGERVVGLGTGRTAEQIFRSLLPVLPPDCVLIPTSVQAELAVRKSGRVPSCLSGVSEIEVYFDGADFADAHGNLIKGLGGAITKEKIAMHLARRTVIVIQPAKLVSSFDSMHVPVEIVKEALSLFTSELEKRGVRYCIIKASNGVSPTATESGNLLLNVQYNQHFLDVCSTLPGVVSHGFVPRTENTHIALVEGSNSNIEPLNATLTP